MSKSPSAPTRDEVVSVLRRLIEGKITREVASAWASPWVIRLEDVNDRHVSRALESLSGADMITTDRPYLFMESDFKRWLRDLNDSPCNPS